MSNNVELNSISDQTVISFITSCHYIREIISRGVKSKAIILDKSKPVISGNFLYINLKTKLRIEYASPNEEESSYDEYLISSNLNISFGNVTVVTTYNAIACCTYLSENKGNSEYKQDIHVDETSDEFILQKYIDSSYVLHSSLENNGNLVVKEARRFPRGYTLLKGIEPESKESRWVELDSRINIQPYNFKVEYKKALHNSKH